MGFRGSDNVFVRKRTFIVAYYEDRYPTDLSMNILITGVSKGLGLQLALAYAERGHFVFGVSRTPPQKTHPRVNWRSMDICSIRCGSMISDFLAEYDSLDLLINNAGSASFGSNLASVDPDVVRDQINLHCVGALAVSKAALPFLIKSPNPKIINVTSRLGSVFMHQRGDFKKMNFSYAYRIAKSAQNMLTLCMQGDQSLSRIIIAAVNPGLLRTDSGTTDAKNSAAEGAQHFMDTIDNIVENGIYHAFGEDTAF